MLVSKAKWDFIKNQDKPNDLDDYSSVISTLLLQRGITTKEAAKNFLTPDLDKLHHPSGLSMIDKAIERVHKAINSGERILVYGDYDADGVSSTALLLKALQELNARCDYYIPNRFSEGYGPNEDAFREAANRGFTVIITVDTGISAVHEAEIAKELGIDLIITDHHELQEQLPDSYATINPKCSPTYPFHDLAGVGVAFKFAQSLLGYFPEHLLDLVAIGTIADLVPLIDENRILAYHGLQKLTTTTNPGLKALKQICKIEGNVSEENVGFLIGPRINAVGRLEDAQLAVELLMADDPIEAEEIALMIEAINDERRQIVRDIVKEAEQMDLFDEETGIIIAAKEGWNEGVLGIVASQLVRKYDRPAIVLTIKPDTGEMKGSARSIPAFNLFNHCMVIRDLFTQFGGHSQAAGMTLPIENLEMITTELNQMITNQLSKEDFKQIIEVNQTIDIADITEKDIDEINQLAPFGIANPKPVFHLKEIPADVRQIGSQKNHLKFQFKQEGKQLDGIGFGIGELYPHISPQTPISVVGELSINEWNGLRKPQIIIQDVEINEWQLFDHRGKANQDLTAYVKNDEKNVVVCNSSSNLPQYFLNLPQITYETNVDRLEEVDTLFIHDLPTDLQVLSKIVQKLQPKNIHACFYVKNSVYLKAFPTRDDFKWFYSIVYKRKEIDLKRELANIMDAKKWSKDDIVFIAQVFQELNFIMIHDGVVQIHPQPQKRDLQESVLYQNRLKQGEIEKVLYYSNYEMLKKWFSNCMDHIGTSEEEVVYGL